MHGKNYFNYFGYGAMARDEVIAALLGRVPQSVEGYSRFGPTKLENWRLVTQDLSHIPDKAVGSNGVTINPRALLQETWGHDFRSYTIVKEEGFRVYGTFWKELTPPERELIREYELILWGWFEDIPDVYIRVGSHLSVACTEGLRSGQDYDRDFATSTDVVAPMLVSLTKTIEIATRVGEEFRSR